MAASSTPSTAGSVPMGERHIPELAVIAESLKPVYNREVKFDDAAAKTAFKALVDRSQVVEGWNDINDIRRLSNISEDKSIFEDFACSFIPSHRNSYVHEAVLTDLEENEHNINKAAAPAFTNLENVNEIEIHNEARRDSKTKQTLLKYASSTVSVDSLKVHCQIEEFPPGSPLKIVVSTSPTITVSRIMGDDSDMVQNLDKISAKEMQV